MFEAAKIAIKNKNGFICNDPDGCSLFYYEERFLNQLGYGFDPCECDVHVAICECENGRCFTRVVLFGSDGDISNIAERSFVTDKAEMELAEIPLEKLNDFLLFIKEETVDFPKR